MKQKSERDGTIPVELTCDCNHIFNVNMKVPGIGNSIVQVFKCPECKQSCKITIDWSGFSK